MARSGLPLPPDAGAAASGRGTAILVALLGASAVLLGAAGAHLLGPLLGVRGASLWHTAIGYHFWHALAFTLAAFLAPQGRARTLALASFLLGILCFCGSLYALALGAPPALSMIAPVGGLAFVIGWLALGSSFGALARGRPPANR